MPLGGIDGDGEQMDDGRVDADHLTTRVDERSAGVARVEGGVCLNHVFDLPSRPGLQLSPCTLTTPPVTVV
jgi:hypothetical protein